MFIQFQFGNFRSFRDFQTFSMEAAPLRTNDSGLEEGHVFEAGGMRLLRSKAVYGSNASGKSNLSHAIGAFLLMVERSVSMENIPTRIWKDRFQLLENWDDVPVSFQYFFLVGEELFRYGFEIRRDSVINEWLISGTKGQEQLYFQRTGDHLEVTDTGFPGSENFIEKTEQEKGDLFRTDSLFLTSGALLGNKFLRMIREEIRNILGSNNSERPFMDYALGMLRGGTDHDRKAIIDLLSAADTGIENVFVAPYSPQEEKDLSQEQRKRLNKLMSSHTVYNEEGEPVSRIDVPFFNWESNGTTKMLSIGAMMLTVLKYGGTMMVDEFDANLHANLTLKIVELFNNPQTNPRNAQLIFITHDTGLLRRADLRRDQICIVNKDRYGISNLTNLVEFKGVRKDASYEKEYLNGSYSGVPYLDKMNWVINENFDNDLQQAE